LRSSSLERVDQDLRAIERDTQKFTEQPGLVFPVVVLLADSWLRQYSPIFRSSMIA